jgi:hypothetical protein
MVLLSGACMFSSRIAAAALIGALFAQQNVEAEIRDPVTVIFLDDGQAILEEAPRITLYSLDPVAGPLFSFRRNAKPTFHGYRILGSLEISGDAKTDLLGKLYTAIAEDGPPARCFNPRHGVRAAIGNRYVELVICFECRQIESYVNGRKGGGTVGKSAEKYFNDTLQAAGIVPAEGGR